MELTLEQRDALAEKYFPKLWEAAKAKGKSKKRTQLRKAAEHELLKEGLRETGACCANCSSFSSAQIGGNLKTICAADSDFYGYSRTEAHHLCHKWSEKIS